MENNTTNPEVPGMCKRIYQTIVSILSTNISDDSIILDEEYSNILTDMFTDTNINVYLINSSDNRVYVFPNAITLNSPFFIKLRAVFILGPILVGFLSFIESLFRSYTQFFINSLSFILGSRSNEDNNIKITCDIKEITILINREAFDSLSDSEKKAVLLYCALIDAYHLNSIGYNILHGGTLLGLISVVGNLSRDQSSMFLSNTIGMLLTLVFLLLIIYSISKKVMDRGVIAKAMECIESINLSNDLELALTKVEPCSSYFADVNFDNNTISNFAINADTLAEKINSGEVI